MTSDSILLPPVNRIAAAESAPLDAGRKRKKPSTEPQEREPGEVDETTRRRRQIIRWSIASVVTVVVFSLVWVGVRGAILAGTAVEAAGSATNLATLIDKREFAAADAEVAELQRLVAEASTLTSDPVWRMVELVPVLGGNLTTIRQSAAALTTVTEDALSPLVTLVATMGPEQLGSASRVDRLLGLAAIAPQLAEIDSAMTVASGQLASVDTSTNVGVLADGFGQLNGGIQYYAAANRGLHGLMPLVPSLTSEAGSSSWLVSVTAGAAEGRPAEIANFAVHAGPAGLQFGEPVTVGSGAPGAAAGAAQEISVDVATMQLIIEQTGPLKVPDVGEVSKQRLVDFSKALARSDAASVAEAQLSIAATARSMIDRLLG